MTWLSWTTLGIAVLGAGLGILNTLHAIIDRRTRLRVTPLWAIAGPGPAGLSIEVVNLSSFPVTIDEMGLTLQRGGGNLPRRIRIPDEVIFSGRQGSTRLERGERKTISFHLNGFQGQTIHDAYALTASGEIVRGTSGALKQFIANGNRPI